MAPMIDMVFLLLVFFMTVSTMAKDARPELELPESEVARVPQNIPPRDVISVMREEGSDRYFHGNRSVGLPELAKALAGEQRAGRLAGVYLRGPADLPWEAWKPVLQVCRELGLEEIVFGTFEP